MIGGKNGKAREILGGAWTIRVNEGKVVVLPARSVLVIKTV